MKLIQIHPADTVAVAVTALDAGSRLSANGLSITAIESIPAGHKIALRDIPAGEHIIKYGSPIGHAVAEISAGSHVHTHNVKSNLSGKLTYTYTPQVRDLPAETPRTFMGYKRPDGKTGIRNEVWIVPTVGCVNSIVREIEKQAQIYKTENIDAIASFCHPYGCSQLGDDQAMTLRYLAGMIRHPNAAAVLVVGLGCENGNIEELKKVLGTWDENRVKFLVAQECEDEIAEAGALLKDLCNVEACVALFGPLTMHCVIPVFNTVYKRINVSFSENFVATMPEDWSALSAMFSVQGSVLMLSQEKCRQVETILSLLEREAKPQNQRLLLMYYLVVLQDVDVKDENRTQLPPYVAGAIQYMHEHYAEKVTAEMLAEWLDVGRTTLLMSFHRIMGVTVHQYLVNLRMKRVKELHEQGMPLAEAAEKCGFCDLGGYIRAYRRLFGTTPKGKGKK